VSDVNTTESAAQNWARAVVYSGLAHGFRYPDPVLFELLADEERLQVWSSSLSLTVGGETEDPFSRFQRNAHCDTGTPEWSLEALQAAHNSLFGHAVRGPCPAYEGEYGRSEISQRASQLADLAGFYEAFGMTIVDCDSRRPDWVSVECEFMSVLCARQAHGCETDDMQLCQRCRDAQRQFLKDHLARWVPAFARRVVEAEAHAFYTALAGVADRFVRMEADRCDIHAGPRWLELRTVDVEAETSINCFDSVQCGPAAAERFTELHVDLRGS